MTDITLAAYGRMVYTSLAAADRLAERGVEAEVIDLRTLQPLDIDTIVQSVEKTNRVVIVEENWRTGGFSAEIASTVHEAAFDYLDGPVGRVNGQDVPAPYNATLGRPANTRRGSRHRGNRKTLQSLRRRLLG